MSEEIGLRGPVEERDGHLVLDIPVEAGGAALADAARGIGAIEGESLVIRVPGWLAEKLGITVGSLVSVSNAGGKFNIFPVTPRGEPGDAAS